MQNGNKIFANNSNIKDMAFKGYCVQSGCVVTGGGAGQMKVHIAAGAVWRNGILVAVAAQDVVISTADASYPRKDIIYIDSTGTGQALPGSPLAAVPIGSTGPNTVIPIPPDIPTTDTALCEVWVGKGVTGILTANITDISITLALPQSLFDWGNAFRATVTGITNSPTHFQSAELAGHGDNVFIGYDAYVMWDSGGAGAAPQKEKVAVISSTDEGDIELDGTGYTVPLAVGDVVIMKLQSGGGDATEAKQDTIIDRQQYIGHFKVVYDEDFIGTLQAFHTDFSSFPAISYTGGIMVVWTKGGNLGYGSRNVETFTATGIISLSTSPTYTDNDLDVEPVADDEGDLYFSPVNQKTVRKTYQAAATAVTAYVGAMDDTPTADTLADIDSTSVYAKLSRALLWLQTLVAGFGTFTRSLKTQWGTRWDTSGDLGTDVATLVAGIGAVPSGMATSTNCDAKISEVHKQTAGTGDGASTMGKILFDTNAVLPSSTIAAKTDLDDAADEALVDVILDKFISAADGGTHAYPDSVVSKSQLSYLMSKAATPVVTSFDNTTDSMEAISDKVTDCKSALLSQGSTDFNSTCKTSIQTAAAAAITAASLALASNADAKTSDVKTKTDKITNAVYRLIFKSAGSDMLPSLAIPHTAADLDFPSIITTAVPTGATVTKAYYGFSYSKKVDSSAGANAVNAASKTIRVNVSTGAWGTDDIVCYTFVNGGLANAASATEGGNILFSTTDVKAKVTGAALTFTFRSEQTNRSDAVTVTGASLTLYDVESWLIVEYTL